MSNLNEKVSYLKGLMEGMGMDQSTNEGKLFAKIIETMEDFAREVEYVNEDLTEIDEYIDALDDDLTELENDFYDLDEEDFENLDEDEEDEDDEFYEIECPLCDEEFYLEEPELVFDENGLMRINCPKCNGVIIINEEMDYFTEDEYEAETEV